MATFDAGRHKLLLADDSVAIQKVVQLTFADEGCEVAIASNGVEALRLLAEFQPEVVLADVSMPGLDGYEVCRRIKQDQRFRHLPVILLVGIFEPFDAKEAREAGADDVLTKPFQSIREMLNKVGAYLSGRPYKPELEDEPRPLGISPPPQSSPPAPQPPAPRPSSSSSPLMRETVSAPPPEATPAAAAATPADDADAVFTDHAATASSLSSPSPFASLSAEASAVDEGPARGADDESPFVTSPIEADALDDQTIEVKPMDDLADNYVSSSAPASELPVAETSAFAASTDESANPTNLESSMSLPSEERYPEPAFTSAMTPPIQRPAASSVTNATDDSLLDLGDQQSANANASVPTLSDNDDMILDLGDEPVYAAGPASDQPPPPPPPAAGRSAVSLDQLSPEAIDAIARRVAEHLSTRAIEDVAWEVVPQLAELLIKQQLEAGKLRKQ